MKRISILTTLISALSLLALPATAATEHTLSRAALLDKIRGGWAGQMIGVAYSSFAIAPGCCPFALGVGLRG